MYIQAPSGFPGGAFVLAKAFGLWLSTRGAKAGDTYIEVVADAMPPREGHGLRWADQTNAAWGREFTASRLRLTAVYA
jgi:hypothetical protein